MLKEPSEVHLRSRILIQRSSRGGVSRQGLYIESGNVTNLKVFNQNTYTIILYSRGLIQRSNQRLVRDSREVDTKTEAFYYQVQVLACQKSIPLRLIWYGNVSKIERRKKGSRDAHTGRETECCGIRLQTDIAV
jgi:hypothetical protein